MEEKMRKVVKNKEEQNAVTMSLKDILRHVKSKNQNHMTTEHVGRIELMLKGWVVKKWMNVQQE